MLITSLGTCFIIAILKRPNKCSGAWQGVPIILRQVSPEAPTIFALIKELHRECVVRGELLINHEILQESEELQQFLSYAATFLSNMGNYFVSLFIRFLSSR